MACCQLVGIIGICLIYESRPGLFLRQISWLLTEWARNGVRVMVGKATLRLVQC